MSGVLSEAVGDGVVRGVDGLAEYNRIRMEGHGWIVIHHSLDGREELEEAA